MAQLTQANRLLALNTPLGEDAFLLTSMVGQEEMSRLFSYRLEMVSTEEAIAASDIVGKNVTFSVQRPDESRRHFNGFVSRFANLGRQFEELTLYRAEVVPWLWFLTRTSDCRIFQEKSVVEIIEQIFGDLGFSDFETSEIRGTHPKWDYCVQYRETDFNFISRLAEHEGIFYYFRHEDGKHTLVLADQKAAYKALPEDEVPFVSDVGSQLHEEHITSWEHQYEFRPGKWAQTDYNFETPSTDLMTQESSIVKLPGIDKYEIYDYPGTYESKSGNGRPGESLTRIRMEEEEVAHDIVSGASSCKTFSPGGKFTIKDHPNSSEDGKSYVITSIRHEAINPVETRGGGTTSEDYGNSFTCIPDSVTFRPARITPKPVVQGPQTAVVVGPPGETIYPDPYGRVKVQFYWDREGKKDENSSCWMRVAQNWGGSNWGGMFIPHVGQEVIVAFLEGDPDRPLIVGRVYNAEQMPPLELPANKTKSAIRDHGGNEIIMEGDGGKEQIRMFSPYAETRFTMGAPNSPGEGFNFYTNALWECYVAQDYAQNIDGSKNTYIKGDFITRVNGYQEYTTLGDYTTRVMGASYTTVVGLCRTTTIGVLSETMIAMNIRTLTGGLIEINKVKEFYKGPKLIQGIKEGVINMGKETKRVASDLAIKVGDKLHEKGTQIVQEGEELRQEGVDGFQKFGGGMEMKFGKWVAKVGGSIFLKGSSMKQKGKFNGNNGTIKWS